MKKIFLILIALLVILLLTTATFAAIEIVDTSTGKRSTGATIWDALKAFFSGFSGITGAPVVGTEDPTVAGEGGGGPIGMHGDKTEASVEAGYNEYKATAQTPGFGAATTFESTCTLTPPELETSFTMFPSLGCKSVGIEEFTEITGTAEYIVDYSFLDEFGNDLGSEVTAGTPVYLDMSVEPITGTKAIFSIIYLNIGPPDEWKQYVSSLDPYYGTHEAGTFGILPSPTLGACEPGYTTNIADTSGNWNLGVFFNAESPWYSQDPPGYCPWFATAYIWLYSSYSDKLEYNTVGPLTFEEDTVISIKLYDGVGGYYDHELPITVKPACEPITNNACVDEICCVKIDPFGRYVYEDSYGLNNHGMYLVCVGDAAKNVCDLRGRYFGELVSEAGQSNVNK